MQCILHFKIIQSLKTVNTAENVEWGKIVLDEILQSRKLSRTVKDIILGILEE